MIIRVGTPNDGPAIERLLKIGGTELPGIQWEDNYPFWVVAEKNEKIIGCMQIMGSRPVAHGAFFVVHPDHRNSSAAWKIYQYALSNLRAMGIAAISFFVDEDNQSYKDMIERHGSEVITTRGFIYYRDTSPLGRRPRVDRLNEHQEQIKDGGSDTPAESNGNSTTGRTIEIGPSSDESA